VTVIRARPTAVAGVEVPQRRARPARLPSLPTVWLVAWVAVGTALRTWGLGSRPLNLDESFEALTARRAPADLLPFLAHFDTAPPLSYLLRSPFLAVQATGTMARVPSAACSVAALVLFALWMRRRGILGMTATALFAVDGFVVHFGREGRMYAVLELVGVGAAMVCEAWLRSPRRRFLVAIAGIGLAGAFLHVEALILLVGVFTLPGLRRDREAWLWRGAVAAPMVVYAAAWGWALAIQRSHSHQPGRHTSPGAVVDVLGALVTSSQALRLFAMVAVVAGAVPLVRRHSSLGRTWLACFAVPVAVTLLLAARLDILLPRFFAYAAWAPLVTIAALVEVAATRRAALGLIAGVVSLAFVLPAGVDSPGYAGPAAEAVWQLERVTRPGDAVAVQPFWLGYLVEWNLGARRPILTRPGSILGVDDVHVTQVPGGRPTARVWLLEPADATSTVVGAKECAPEWTDGVSRLRCFQRPP